MLKVNRLHLAASALAIGGLSLNVATEALAQTNSGQNAAGGILGLFGTIAQEAAKSNARKRWDQTTPEIKQCVNTMFAAKNISVDQIAAAGIAPNDARISQLVASCQTIMTAQPKTNFPCNVTNSKGQQVATTCNESFAKEVNGSLVPISRDDFLRAAGNGEKVQVANFEAVAAQNARLAEERRLAEAERQRFLASPEGKQQAAANAAKEKAERRNRLVSKSNDAFGCASTMAFSAYYWRKERSNIKQAEASSELSAKIMTMGQYMLIDAGYTQKSAIAASNTYMNSDKRYFPYAEKINMRNWSQSDENFISSMTNGCLNRYVRSPDNDVSYIRKKAGF